MHNPSFVGLMRFPALLSRSITNAGRTSPRLLQLGSSSVVVVVCLSALVQASASGQITARLLPTEPIAPAGSNSEARGISRSGRIIGSVGQKAAMWLEDGSVVSFHPTQAEQIAIFVADGWDPDYLQQYPPNLQSSWAVAISADGSRQVVNLAGSWNDADRWYSIVRENNSFTLRRNELGWAAPIRAISNTHEGGGYEEEPLLWSGAVLPPVNLAPLSRSYLAGMSEQQQVGAIAASSEQAVLWSGSAESMVLLGPVQGGDVYGSAALATDGTTQGGYVYGSFGFHAARWSGTASSFTNLHTGSGSASQGSQVLAVDAGLCVGWMTRPGSGDTLAALWRADNTYVNLHALLPPSSSGQVFQRSSATGVLVRNGEVRVVGHASWIDQSEGFEQFRAVEWVSPEPFVATSLHPTGAQWSRIESVSPTQQVGRVRSGNVWRAAKWTGTPNSYVELSPPNTNEAGAWGIDGAQQAGSVKVTGGPGFRAMLWSGTAASAVDITPAIPGLTSAEILGARAGQQIGAISLPNAQLGFSAPLAGIWRGTADSWVNLHPPGWAYSIGRGTDGVFQVGDVWPQDFFNPSHAALWNGSVDTFVDLHPTGSTQSFAYAVDQGQQVGIAYFPPNATGRAALWTGSSQSFVNLHPQSVPSSQQSGAFDVHRGVQVGYVGQGSAPRAALWQSTAATYLDLHQFLPPNYNRSQAYAVWSTPSEIIIGGEAFNNSTGVWEAMLWRRGCFSITAEPENASVCTGVPVTFTVETADSPSSFTFQWSRNGAAIDPVANPTAVTASLVVTGNAGTVGQYTCLISRSSCSATTSPVTLSISVADFNCTGGVTVQDLFDFLAAYFTGTPASDINGSGGITVQDLFDFLAAYFTGN